MEHIDALTAFGIKSSAVVRQIYKSTWDVDDTFVLKKSNKPAQFYKGIMLSRLLSSKGLPVIEYINTIDGNPYFTGDDGFYCLMKKIKGEHLDPFSGDCRHNGVLLGEAIARLHQALSGITIEQGIRDADFVNELEVWIIPELDEKHLTDNFDEGVILACAEFAKDCKLLPIQIIHRDMHIGNLLFKKGEFTGYLDFDISQRNIRIFDICYLGCSLLADSYKDEKKLEKWKEIFSGIIDGYRSIEPLGDMEINAFPGLFVFIEVLFTAFFSKQNQSELAQSCINMTNWLFRNINSILKSI